MWISIGERRQATLALGRQNRALRLMSGVAQALIRHEDESTMLAEICSLAVEIGGYQGAWIAQAMDDFRSGRFGRIPPAERHARAAGPAH